MKRFIIFLLAAIPLFSRAQTPNDSVGREVKLPEVTVKVKPIEQNGDTIKYNVLSFKDKEDHYLEDVLKKLPGIEVGENGTISYKGNSINHFNIEGQDLLGNRYNQATRNLPVDAVAQVQIMENDQPIRALKNRIPSERATLNIKLKREYKLKPFGEAQGGIGFSDNTLWDNHITLINIAKKNQTLITVKMNNTGENISENTLDHIDVANLDNYIPLPDNIITTSSATYLPIQLKRYLSNKSYSMGINLLHRIGRYGNFRTNLIYYGTSDLLADSTSSLYGGSPTLSLNESNRRKSHEHTFVPQFRYELNTPKVYLVDDLSASLSYTDNINHLNSNENLLQEHVARHTSYAQNKLQMTLNAGTLAYNINSSTRYLRRSELMGVEDSSSTYNSRERLILQQLFTRNSLSTTLPLLGNNIELKYGMEYKVDRLKAGSSDFKQTHYFLNKVGVDYSIRYHKGFVAFDFPLNVFSSSISWSETNKSDTKIYISPSIHWKHDLSPFWRLKILGSLDDDLDNSIMYSDSILTNYRTWVNPSERFGWKHLSSLLFSVNYANFITMFTWNLTASASWRKTDHHNQYSYEERYTVITPIWADTHSHMLLVQTSVDKTFTHIGFSAKGTVNYTRNILPVAQNNVQQTVKSNILSPSMKLRWNKLTWLQLSNESTFNLSWQDYYQNHAGYSLRSWFDEFNLYLYPLRKISVSAGCEYSSIETEKGKYNRNAFVDARITYTPTKRLELRAILSNAFNRRQYIEASYTGLNYQYYSVPLRGREFLFCVKFNL